MGIMVESNERDSELSESGLSTNSDERAIQFQKITENGKSESKVDASSERNALNFQNKDTPQETTIKTNKLHPENVIIPPKIYHQNIKGLREKTKELLRQLHPAFPHIFMNI